MVVVIGSCFENKIPDTSHTNDFKVVPLKCAFLNILKTIVYNVLTCILTVFYIPNKQKLHCLQYKLPELYK